MKSIGRIACLRAIANSETGKGIITMKISICACLLFTLACAISVKGESDCKEHWFIANDMIRLGIDLSSGGSIFHFSQLGSNRNLLNHYDRGRFIQQSYYGDEDGSRWAKKDWRWNPVQGGDYKGNPARILDSQRLDEALYVISIPMHWADGTEMTDATMEQWVSLDGMIAHIRYRFTYTGEYNHKPYHQEMPAVFVDHALPNLVYYEGEKPWTSDSLTSVVPGWPNEYYQRTEEWSAYVDDRGWGIGVYTPGTFEMTAYRYKGPDGPQASGCSYFSPIRILAITNGFQLTYDVYLTIGMVADIRERFQSLRETF